MSGGCERMDMKRCSKCGETLTLEMFYKSSKGKYGRASKCKECALEYDKQYQEENKERLIMSRASRYNENKESIKEYHKKHYQDNKEAANIRKKIYRSNNSEAQNEYERKYRIVHREQIKISEKKRDAKARELPHTLTIDQWEKAKQYFSNCCAYCGKELPLFQEHFVALSKGGEYSHDNIIPACMSCNCSKNNRDFFEWYPDHSSYDKDRKQLLLNFLNYKGNRQ